MTLDPGAASPRATQRFIDAEAVTAPASPEGRSGFLTDVIVDLGLASPAAVEEAVEISRLEGGTADEILVQNGVITEEQLAIALAERNGLPYVDLVEFEVDQGAARLIPSETARRYRAVPIAFDADGALVVAIADPLDALAVSDIGVITKSETRVAVATDSAIEALLATLPESKSAHPISARGMDGIGAARSAGVSGWSLASSISSPGAPSEAGGVPDQAIVPEQPIVDQAPVSPAANEPDHGPANFPGADAGPAEATQPAAPERAGPPVAQPAVDQASPGLESRIDALVAAALDKHLGSDSPAPAADPELERTREELDVTRAELDQARIEGARAREEAMQARAELQALTARLEQLEGMQPQRF